MLTTKQDNSDSIDQAIINAFKNKDLLKEYTIKNFRPFDSNRKRAEADIIYQGKAFTVVKGAPQIILGQINPSKELRNKVNNEVNELGKNGYRALGVAKAENSNWQYLGLIPLFDPPREDSAKVIKEAQDHGLDIRMITGDHSAIAKQVARQLNLGDNIARINKFVDEKTHKFKKGSNEKQLNDEFMNVSGFAEVTPEDKFNIIKRSNDFNTRRNSKSLLILLIFV
jgi:H+-transporting ATPase